MGCSIQGLFFAPFDLPQYGMNVTTLLVPLFAMPCCRAGSCRREPPMPTSATGRRWRCRQPTRAASSPGSAFWALYGHGFAAANLAAIGSFGAAYMLVVTVEPLVDLAVLAAAKALKGLQGSGLVADRVYQGA